MTVLAMGPGFDLLLSIVSAAASVVLTGFVGIIAFYLRGEYKAHQKNTAVRKWLVGNPEIDEIDDGYRDELDGRFEKIRDDMQAQHETVEKRLDTLTLLVRRLIARYEEDHDRDIETDDAPPFFRGGSRPDQVPDEVNGGD